MSNQSEVVNVSSEEEPQPTETMTRKKKKPMSKEYMRNYYHSHKQTHVCPHCERIYSSKSSLVKHQGRSITCYIQQVKGVLDEIKQSPVEDLELDHKLKKMEAIIYK